MLLLLLTALITDPHGTHNVRCKRSEEPPLPPHLPTFETQ